MLKSEQPDIKVCKKDGSNEQELESPQLKQKVLVQKERLVMGKIREEKVKFISKWNGHLKEGMNSKVVEDNSEDEEKDTSRMDEYNRKIYEHWKAS